MRTTALVLGLITTFFIAILMAFTLGTVAAIAAVIILLVTTVAVYFVEPPYPTAAAIAFPVILVVGLGYGGWNGYKLVQALTDESGPSDPADPVALASAEEKIDAAEGQSGFRIELTEAEMSAFLQDGLSDSNTPVKNISVDANAPDEIAFDAEFKSGGLSAEGAVSYELEAGQFSVELTDIDVGAFTVPGFVRGALDDIVEGVLDVNDILDDHRASVQLVEVTDDRIVIVGTQAGGELLTSGSLLDGLRENAEAIGAAVTPPVETYGPGDVDSLAAPGDTTYVALGDSLAASVGVPSQREGYVSRFHKQLNSREGGGLGLRNFGVSGESSGSLIRSGQLDEALDFIGANDVAYITIDIGANDLLGHLGSPECGDGALTGPCQVRIQATLVEYRANLEVIMAELTEAAPGTTIIFLTTYNPFSFGFAAVGLEEDTDQVVQDLNAVAADVADEFGVLVADGFTPLQGTTGSTTHMTDATPDIHPLGIGYDLLTGALVAALP